MITIIANVVVAACIMAAILFVVSQVLEGREAKKEYKPSPAAFPVPVKEKEYHSVMEFFIYAIFSKR